MPLAFPTQESRGLDIVTFGEAMVRLTPPDYERLETAHTLTMGVGGAEFNTAVAISHLGHSAAWVSALPKNPLGRFIANQARSHGVDTQHVIWTDIGKCGVYYVELGAAPRPPAVLYDRQDTAIALMSADAVPWLSLLASVRVLHLSGITPALSASALASMQAAITAAKAVNCRVSFDINYRSKLWSPSAAATCLEPLLRDVDLLFSSIDDLRTLFGFTGEPWAIARAALDHFGVGAVVTGLRHGATDRRSLLIADQRTIETKPTHFTPIDPLGAGDAYAAGFISGWLDGDLDRAVLLGDALAALKHTMPGDLLTITRDEVDQYLRLGTAKVQR